MEFLKGKYLQLTGLYKHTSKLSKRDIAEAEHIFPHESIWQAHMNCKSDVNCRDSDRMKVLDDIFSNQIAFQMWKNDHEETSSHAHMEGSGEFRKMVAVKLYIGMFDEAYLDCFFQETNKAHDYSDGKL